MRELPTPIDVKALAARRGISPAVIEVLYARRRGGGTHAELVNLLARRARGGSEPERGRALVPELSGCCSDTRATPVSDGRDGAPTRDYGRRLSSRCNSTAVLAPIYEVPPPGWVSQRAAMGSDQVTSAAGRGARLRWSCA